MAAYSESHWRNIAAPRIAEVIAKHVGEDENKIRLALRDAYPFGERKYHPYKIWLSEVNIQLGKHPPLHARSQIAKAKIAAKVADETVQDLFGENS
jgi:phenylpyruvate tautomerase PptA (4-oxalocrotonate tautomerase family)